MRRRYRQSLLVSLMLLLLWASEAHAEPDNDVLAATAFEEGTAAFGAGDFVRAADAFERAYAVRPHHDALWNAARARERAGADVRAANLYARYLREAPAAARDRDTAIRALKALGAKLGRIEIHLSEASAITHVRLDGAPFELTTEVWVSPGEHVFDADAPKGPFRKLVRSEAGSVLSVTLEPEPDQPRIDVPNPRRPFPWPVVIAGGVATLALAAVTTWSALDTVDQKKAFNDHRTQENLDEGRSRMTRTNILLGVTSGVLVLTGVVTAVLVLSNKRDVSMGVGPGSLDLGGRF